MQKHSKFSLTHITYEELHSDEKQTLKYLLFYFKFFINITSAHFQAVFLIWMRWAKPCKGSGNNGIGLVSVSRKHTGLIIVTVGWGPLFHCKQFNET